MNRKRREKRRKGTNYNSLVQYLRLKIENQLDEKRGKRKDDEAEH